MIAASKRKDELATSTRRDEPASLADEPVSLAWHDTAHAPRHAAVHHAQRAGQAQDEVQSEHGRAHGVVRVEGIPESQQVSDEHVVKPPVHGEHAAESHGDSKQVPENGHHRVLEPDLLGLQVSLAVQVREDLFRNVLLVPVSLDDLLDAT